MKRNKIIVGIILGFILLLVGGIVGSKLYKDNLERKKILEEERIKKAEEKLIAEIKSKYSSYVITDSETIIYKKVANNYLEVGKIAQGVILNLDNLLITSKTEYFKILGLNEEYYVKYQNVSKTENLDKDKRYLNYLKLDKYIVTSDVTKIYLNDKLIYTFNKSLEAPVYIIDGDRYYIEYNEQLMYVLKEDIKEIKTKTNTNEYAKEIPVIAYHFFYDPAKGEKCDQVICHSVKQFEGHLKYIKENDYFTPTMAEFNLFMEGNIRLPKKSVIITIDDGWKISLGIDLLEKYKLNGTVFLVTSWYSKNNYKTSYVEFQSHSHNMHNQGDCPNGQGGAIQCFSKDKILDDLKLSKEKLGGATAFCYPFYEYNNYSISLLKEAGFKLAFAGYYAGGSLKARVGGNKYQIPRVTLSNTTDIEYLKKIITPK